MVFPSPNVKLRVRQKVVLFYTWYWFFLADAPTRLHDVASCWYQNQPQILQILSCMLVTPLPLVNRWCFTVPMSSLGSDERFCSAELHQDINFLLHMCQQGCMKLAQELTQFCTNWSCIFLFLCPFVIRLCFVECYRFRELQCFHCLDIGDALFRC